METMQVPSVVPEAPSPAKNKGGRPRGVVARPRAPRDPKYVRLNELGKSKSQVEAIQWVAENMVVESPDKKTCPGPIAWGLLQWARTDAKNAADFWASIWLKLLPAKAQLENQVRVADENQSYKDLVRKFMVPQAAGGMPN